mgnify:CR=1 FL=1
MLAGHYAPALYLKRYAPEIPLWSLCLAVQAVDIGYMTLALLDIETATIDNDRAPRFIVGVAPWTHSLVMTLVYGALCFGIGAAMKRARLGAIFAVAVMSHWVADLIVHVPDLPLGFSDTPAVGLGLWQIPLLATALECVLVGFTAGRFRNVAAVLIALQFANDLVLPMDSDLHIVAIKALGLYFGVAAFAWWAEKRLPAAEPVVG